MFSTNVFIFFTYFLGGINAHNLVLEGQMKEQNIFKPKFPWIGILSVKRVKATHNYGIAGIILVAKRVAIGNANDISKINLNTIRNTTTARFYKDGVRHKIDVFNYLLHPEYNQPSVNTIALVYLDPQNLYLTKRFWSPINWPHKKFDFHAINDTFTVGFIDRHHILMQQKRRMRAVYKTLCKKFYVQENLDFKSIWPRHTTCYRDANEKGTCLYDPGMALVTNIKGDWILLGMSIYGPGCHLPARFIRLFPYTEWIINNLPPEDKSVHNTRRRNLREWDDWDLPTEPYMDRDRFIINRLYNDSLDLYFLKQGETLESVGLATQGSGYMGWKTDYNYSPLVNKNIKVNFTCPPSMNHMHYKEQGYIRTLPASRNWYFFHFSYYDLKVSSTRCIKMRVKAKESTIIKWSYSKGFGMDDVSHLISEDTKTFGDLTIPNKQDYTQSKILFIQDNWEAYNSSNTLSLEFKILFFGMAELDIEFRAEQNETEEAQNTTALRQPGWKGLKYKDLRQKEMDEFKKQEPVRTSFLPKSTSLLAKYMGRNRLHKKPTPENSSENKSFLRNYFDRNRQQTAVNKTSLLTKYMERNRQRISIDTKDMDRNNEQTPIDNKALLTKFMERYRIQNDPLWFTKNTEPNRQQSVTEEADHMDRDYQQYKMQTSTAKPFPKNFSEKDAVDAWISNGKISL